MSLLLAGCLAAACGAVREPTESRRIDRAAESYLRIVAALGEQDPDSLDFYAGPPEFADEARTSRPPLRAIRKSVDDVLDDLSRHAAQTADDDARRRFLTRQLRAVSARLDILEGARPGFDDESERLFGVGIGERDRSRFARVRADIARLLPGSGGLGRRYAEFDKRFAIPPDRLRAVIARAVDGCRDATLRHLQFPSGERVTIEYARDMPWSAFTKYEGGGHSRTRINSDFAPTIDRALELACHETYPGHHVINLLIDRELVQGKHRIELTAQPLFSPQSLRTEGAATVAMHLAFPDDERLRFERDVLFPVAGLNPDDAERYLQVCRLVDELRWLQADIARRYLDGALEFVRASAALEDEALMPSADATLKFFNEFRTSVVTYTIGPELVWKDVRSDDPAARWKSYARWVTETP